CLSFLLGWPERTETLYLAFPFVIWAALRFGTRGASLAILTAAVLAQCFNAFGLGSIGKSDLSTAAKNVEMLVSLGVFSFVGILSGIALDARRRAEERTRRSEQRFQRAIRGSSAGVWDWDVRADTTFYAPRFKTLLGYDDSTFAA